MGLFVCPRVFVYHALLLCICGVTAWISGVRNITSWISLVLVIFHPWRVQQYRTQTQLSTQTQYLQWSWTCFFTHSHAVKHTYAGHARYHCCTGAFHLLHWKPSSLLSSCTTVQPSVDARQRQPQVCGRHFKAERLHQLLWGFFFFELELTKFGFNCAQFYLWITSSSHHGIPSFIICFIVARLDIYKMNQPINPLGNCLLK